MSIFRRKKKTETFTESNLPSPIRIKKFAEHHVDITTHYNKLKAEYTLLSTKTSEIDFSTSVGELPENKSKNRYTNIMPCK